MKASSSSVSARTLKESDSTIRYPSLGPEGETLVLLEQGRRLHWAEMQRLKMKHRAGMSGKEVVKARSLLIDRLVRQISDEMSGKTRNGNGHNPSLTLVALGGYGRQELAPYSDVDIMILRQGSRNSEEDNLIQAMLCLLWDMGFQVGHSVRSIKEALSIFQSDLVSQASMLDARLISGNEKLYGEFRLQIDRSLRRQSKSFGRKLLASLQERHSAQGGTAFVQEPNLKEAKGGLRDFHSIHWLALGLYPGQSLTEVLALSQVSPREWSKTRAAYEFLLRIRNELHFLTGRRTDTLSHSLLNQVAGHLDSSQQEHSLNAEPFLKQYYLHARRISQALESIVTHSKLAGFHPDVSIGRRILTPSVPRSSRTKGVEGRRKAGLETPESWVRLLRYSQADPSLRETINRLGIRQDLQNCRSQDFQTPALTASFRAILRNKGRVAPVIRLMHDLGLLGRILPEFGRLTCLVQHDPYHKYTTDEHTLRALEILDQVTQGKEERQSSYFRILSEVRDSSSLYFALLMHDTGRGAGKRHSAKGEMLVEKAVQRLGFDPDEAEKILTLVRHHTLMEQVSQRRNLEDPHTIEEFVGNIERVDILNMLTLMTYADAQVVGPGVWTEWKDYQLLDLYHKAYDRLMFSEDISPSAHQEVESVRKKVTEALAGEIGEERIQAHFDRLPEKYALYTPVPHIVEHVRLGQRVEQAQTAIRWLDQPGRGYIDLILSTRDHPGLFAQIAGALASFNVNILSAQLNTRSDGWVFDVFQVGRPGPIQSLLPEDYPRIEAMLKEVITGRTDVEKLLEAQTTHGTKRNQEGVSFPPLILIDNQISPSATVIEVQAEDRVGLGYHIAKTLANSRLNIIFAKLTTEKAHAFDVFYVQDQTGKKVTDARRMAELLERLRRDLEDLGHGAPAG